jgi:cellulose synthase/poly-beta-1,6-N-acetylglucosamine synthase-like glycosyltransferase
MPNPNFSNLIKPLLMIEIFLLLPFEIVWFLGVNNVEIGLLAILFSIFISVFDTVFLVDSIYNLVIGMFGLRPRSIAKNRKNHFLITPPTKYYKFVLLICAHNEDAVIGNSLQEMIKANYPVSRLRIVVVCDNCTDNTYNSAMKLQSFIQKVLLFWKDTIQ